VLADGAAIPHIKLMKPVICNYYLTYRCNARCHFCTIWSDKSVPADLESSPETVAANLDDARNAGVRIVDFTGGEPLLYEALPDVLAHAKRIGLRTTVTTNGIRYPGRAREIAGLVDILQFSLQAADGPGHDAVTVTPSFDKIMSGVETARSLGERPTFIHTVTDTNIGAVPDVTALARTHKIPLFLNPCFGYAGTPGLSRGNAIQLKKLARGPWVSADMGFIDFITDGGNHSRKPFCRAVSSVIVISPDNRLILPCFHNRTGGISLDRGLAHALASDERAREMRREGRHPFCEGCTVYCYLRASIFRSINRYTIPSLISAADYLLTLYRAERINRALRDGCNSRTTSDD